MDIDKGRRCPYCGQPVIGRPNKKYCSKECRSRFNALASLRRLKGAPKLKQCRHCGKVLLYSNAGGIYCSAKCRQEDRQIADNCNELRQAVLLQAQRDGALERYADTAAFGYLFPELDPEAVKRIERDRKKKRRKRIREVTTEEDEWK